MAETKGKLPFLGKGVAQVALVVADLERTVERYWTQFGIGPWQFYTYERPFVRRMTRNGEPADYAMRVALANVGPTRLELIEQKRGDTVYAEFTRAHGFGVHHLGVLVDDMASAIREARLAGYRVTMDGAGFGADGDGHYAYLDTENDLGTTIELIERPNRRSPPEKVYPPEAAAGGGKT